jgi:hypothetical protein
MSVKSVLALGIFLILSAAFPSHAGSPKAEYHLVSTDKQVEMFVQKFNAADFEQIYAQTSDSFQELTPKSAFVRFLKSDIAPFGRIKSFAVEEDSGDQKIYMLVFDDGARERRLELRMGINPAGQIAAFSLSNPPKKCPESSEPTTDNPQAIRTNRPRCQSVCNLVRVKNRRLPPHSTGAVYWP